MRNRSVCLLVMIMIVFACSEGDNTTPPEAEIEKFGKLYFTEHSGRNIGVIDPALLGEHTILANHFDDGLNSPIGITIDVDKGMLYAVEPEANRIIKMKADGTGAIEVLYDGADGVGAPQGIAIDISTNKIYWTNEETHQIIQGDMNGATAALPLYNGAEVFDYDSYGLWIHEDLIYFSDRSWGRINVGNLDGSEIPTTVISSPKGIHCTSGIQVVGDKVYWADDCAHKILVANADGSGQPQILFDEDDGLNGPFGIAVDKENNKIYWSEVFTTVIAGGNLDGSGNRQVIEEGLFIYGIVLGKKN